MGKVRATGMMMNCRLTFEATLDKGVLKLKCMTMKLEAEVENLIREDFFRCI